jgi:hypothetical protein
VHCQLVSLNLITSAPTNQLIPMSGPHISIAIPIHNLTEPFTSYGQEVQEYLAYNIPGSAKLCAEGLSLDASPHEFSEIIMHFEMPFDSPLIIMQRSSTSNCSYNKAPPPYGFRSASLAPASSWLPKQHNLDTDSIMASALAWPSVSSRSRMNDHMPHTARGKLGTLQHTSLYIQFQT